MATCDNCGASVSQMYFRGFSVDGTLYGCQQCMTRDEVRATALAHADTRDPTTPE